MPLHTIVFLCLASENPNYKLVMLVAHYFPFFSSSLSSCFDAILLRFAPLSPSQLSAMEINRELITISDEPNRGFYGLCFISIMSSPISIIYKNNPSSDESSPAFDLSPTSSEPNPSFDDSSAISINPSPTSEHIPGSIVTKSWHR